MTPIGKSPAGPPLLDATSTTQPNLVAPVPPSGEGGATAPLAPRQEAFDGSAPPAPGVVVPPTAFADMASAYPGGLTLGDPVKFADRDAAELQLAGLSRNQLVPPAESALPAKVEFPSLQPNADFGGLAEALNKLDLDQLGWVAVRMGARSLEVISGSRELGTISFEMLQTYESEGRLGDLAEAIARAPVELAGSGQLPAQLTWVTVAAALNRLPDQALREVARNAGIGLEDLAGSTRLGLAVSMASHAQSRGGIGALRSALAAATP